MNHRRFHWLEKLHVQLATAALLLAAYFVAWPLVKPADSLGPVNFVPSGNLAELAAFAVSVWVLAILCGLVTAAVRPQGALMSLFLAVAGLSLRSHSIRSLLWSNEQAMGKLFWELLGELALLAAIMAGAVVLVGLMRAIVFRLRPGWLWRDPLAQEAPSHGPGDVEGQKKSARPALPKALLQWLEYAGGRRQSLEPAAWGGELRRAGAFAASGLLTAAVAVSVLLQSSDRGQVIFAVFAGFALAGFVAHQLFPTLLGSVACALPVVLGASCYLLAALTTASGPGAWMNVRLYAQVLPIDWVTEGAGGALLGYWISSRLHEVRHFESQMKIGEQNA